MIRATFLKSIGAFVGSAFLPKVPESGPFTRPPGAKGVERAPEALDDDLEGWGDDPAFQDYTDWELLDPPGDRDYPPPIGADVRKTLRVTLRNPNEEMLDRIWKAAEDRLRLPVLIKGRIGDVCCFEGFVTSYYFQEEPSGTSVQLTLVGVDGVTFGPDWLKVPGLHLKTGKDDFDAVYTEEALDPFLGGTRVQL